MSFIGPSCSFNPWLRTAATVLDPLFHNLRSAELVEGAARLDRMVEGLTADQ
jgi:hypothetical protein